MHIARSATASVPGSPDGPLADGSRIAVIGGGPAGSLFSHLLLDLAARMRVRYAVDIYEPRSFDRPGPGGCNMCGGIVSESLVQDLALDGVTLDPGVVQRGIDSYVLHTDVGSVRIAAAGEERRIGAVHRGSGPRITSARRWASFDAALLANATARGATVIPARVESVSRADGQPTVTVRGGEPVRYDLVVVATGVNTATLAAFEGLGIGYVRPRITKTLLREYHLGEEAITATLGSSMHVFLPSDPTIEFAALVPKGDTVTLCLLGEEIDTQAADAFAASREVRAAMPAGWNPAARACQCRPFINIRGVERPFADRVVFIGDSGVTRLYKDGLGAAYRTAKAAARTVVFAGVSETAFAAHYLPVCRSIRGDNRLGRWAFRLVRVARRARILRRSILSIVLAEQGETRPPRLSPILWDLFTGSAPYGDILRRMLDPRLAWSGLAALSVSR